MAKKVGKSSSLVRKRSVASYKKSSGAPSATEKPESPKQPVTKGLIEQGQQAAAVERAKRQIANMKLNAKQAEAIIEMARRGRCVSGGVE